MLFRRLWSLLAVMMFIEVKTVSGATSPTPEKDCGQVPLIANGFITLANQTDTTYGALANVTCNTGYKSNISVISCTKNDTWEMPVCGEIDCGEYNLVFGRWFYKLYFFGTTYGSEVTVECADGYELNGGDFAVCEADGVWSNYVTCELIAPQDELNGTLFADCGQVPLITNGSITLANQTNSTYGTMANVTCNTGYESNTSVISCTENGIWEMPVCREIDCGEYNLVSGKWLYKLYFFGTTYGSEVFIGCADGYKVNGGDFAVCGADGVWSNYITCKLIDCGNLPVIDNGRITQQNTQNTTFGAMANVSCNTGYNTTTPLINCTANGTWQIPSCKIIDCGNLTKAPGNGSLVPLESTTYKSIATYTCKTGYQIVGNATRQCLANATWSSMVPTCKIRDCGAISAPQNGQIVNTTVVTTYGAKILFACNAGYLIVGESSIVCLSTGNWSGTPTCYKEKPKTCTSSKDSRGTVWPETPVSTTARKPCQEGFEGEVTRYCNTDGIWQLPQYSCVRKAVQAVNEKVNTLTENATAEEVNEALKEITNITSETTTTTNTSQKLTDGELIALATSLEKVATVISEISVVNDNITDSFIESASNLIDTSNQDSWKSLSTTNNSGAGKVLAAVESIGSTLSRSLKNPTTPKTLFVKRNLALEVEEVSEGKPVSFPSPESVNASTNDTKWIAQSQSKITLQPAALKDKNTTYVTIVVMYRDVSKILPGAATNNRSNDFLDEHVINGPVFSLSTIPPVIIKLEPPVTITFEHDFLNLSVPQCAYWNFTSNSWFNDGCILSESNDSFTTCKCNHLTNFAVLMSPFQQADTSPKALRIISMVGIGISILCLIMTLLVHFILWKYLRNDRTTALMNLCIALLIGYVLFLGGVDRTENRVACIAIAAMLQYIFLVVFSIMLVEGILIAVTVLHVFSAKSRIKVLLTLAWVVPAITVGISLGATKTSGYGNKKFCWLSSKNGVLWAFVGPASFIILINIICLLMVIRALCGIKAMEKKKLAEKVKISLRSLGVLVPLLGVSWIVGIFYVNDSFYFVQYIFATFNSLQGFFIFLFHCLLNEQVKRAIGLIARRKSSTTLLKYSERSTSKDYKNAKDVRETDRMYVDDYSNRQNWRDKVLANAISSSGEELDFTSPMKDRRSRRLAVAFDPDVRFRLSGTSSIEDKGGSRSESRVANKRSKRRPRDSHDYYVDHLSLKRTWDYSSSSKV